MTVDPVLISSVSVGDCYNDRLSFSWQEASIEEGMSVPTPHTTPDGSSFRISKIQDVRRQSLFHGQKFVFQAEKESREGSLSLDVTVTFSPIAIAIISPEDRLRTGDYAEEFVKRMLDTGNLQDVEIHVTSDGAVKVGGDLIDRLLPLVPAD